MLAAVLFVLAAADPVADRIARGEVVVTTEKVAGSDVPRALVRAVIDAPPERVWAILIECGDYVRTMTRIKSSKLVKREGDVDVCEVVADMPFPLPDLTSVSRVQRTVSDARRVRAWKLVEGDYKINEGSWVLTPYQGDPSRTYVEYTLHADPKLPLPNAVVVGAQQKSLPDMIEGLRKQLARQNG